ELYRRLNQSGEEIKDLKFSAQDFASLLQFIEDKAISNHAAKEVFREMYETGKAPAQIVSERGWEQISDERELRLLVEKVIEENPQSVMDYKNGKERALGFLVGQAMKASKGKANPGLANKLIREMIE
ncbi:MAG TPA: Asp-tRNA(Asn)/Glu-tRNA(Gln) amidotransferase GatCAB subunit B, partial [Clostridiales bacterium]|nr:Asp-tRNA(Asn)/Glu-tRNA(Gln) amidotransferase GatCAB subunit B [Clostridiales bacterium]